MNIYKVANRKDQQLERQARARIPRWMLMIACSWFAIQMAGCCNVPKPDLFDGSMIDRAFGCYRDKVWSKRACNLRFANCNRPYHNHFCSGFEAGYNAICKGEDGFVPATPPECYWGFDYQTPDGAQCVNAWFEGYPKGVEAAKRDRAGTYRNIYVSRMIQSAMSQEAASKKAPSSVPVVETQAETNTEQAAEYMPPAENMVQTVVDLGPDYSTTPASFDYQR